MRFTQIEMNKDYPLTVYRDGSFAVALPVYCLPDAFGLGGVTLGRDVPLRGGVAGTLAKIGGRP